MQKGSKFKSNLCTLIHTYNPAPRRYSLVAHSFVESRSGGLMPMQSYTTCPKQIPFIHRLHTHCSIQPTISLGTKGNKWRTKKKKKISALKQDLVQLISEFSSEQNRIFHTTDLLLTEVVRRTKDKTAPIMVVKQQRTGCCKADPYDLS